jgi:hypothetical protein
MPAANAAYRALIRLYPRDFRDRYRDDLVQNFADLVDDRGASAAWARTAIDLSVTVPRYRLEAIMTERHSATTFGVAITLLATAGLLSVPLGFPAGIVLLPVAIALAVAQRGTLARAIRTPDSNRRRRRLTIAGALAVAWAVATVIIVLDLRHEEHWGGKVVVYNLIFFVTLIGAIVSCIVGLLTPKADRHLVRPLG